MHRISSWNLHALQCVPKQEVGFSFKKGLDHCICCTNMHLVERTSACIIRALYMQLIMLMFDDVQVNSSKN